MTDALLAQFVNLLGAMLLMLAFAMISQRRILSLIALFTLQGAVLVLSTLVVGIVTHQPHLYVSAGITFALKVVLIPLLLHRVIDRLSPLGWRREDVCVRSPSVIRHCPRSLGIALPACCCPS
jgi:hydrogenase-4 membrane subunit HyfE